MDNYVLTIEGDGYEFKHQVRGDLDKMIAAFEAAFEGAKVTGYLFNTHDDGTHGG